MTINDLKGPTVAVELQRSNDLQPDFAVRKMNMSAPLVSVVIPTYNYGHFVTDAVESALAQTYPNCEIIVIDDGSTDDTRERLQPFMARIRYVYQPNAGLSAARNRGSAEARGAFMAFLDSDDSWTPRFLEIGMHFLRSSPDLQMVGVTGRRNRQVHWSEVDVERLTVTEVPLEATLSVHPFHPSAIIVRKSALDAAGPFDTTLRSAEDRDMWIRLACVGRIGHIDAQVVNIRVHAGSMSSASNAARMHHYNRLVLDRAFLHPALKGRKLLRLQCLSIADFTAAIAFREARQLRTAWWQSLVGFARWPLPVGKAVRRNHAGYIARLFLSLARESVRATYQAKPSN